MDKIHSSTNVGITFHKEKTMFWNVLIVVTFVMSIINLGLMTTLLIMNRKERKENVKKN